MSDTAQTVAQTALQTAVTLAPTLAAVDPKVAAVVALAPIALALLQAATKAQQAGLISEDQLASLWGSTGQNIQSTHNAWAAMNAADAAKA